MKRSRLTRPVWSSFLISSLFSLAALAQEFPPTVDLNRKLDMLPAGAVIEMVTLDASGNIYVAGTTPSGLAGPASATTTKLGSLGNDDVFVVKLNPAADQIVYATLIGGLSNESVRVIRADAAGNLYLAGTTNSLNFPATTQLVPSNPVGGFVAKLNSTGTALAYALQLGSRVFPLGLDVDSAGAAYVSGQAGALDLPTTLGVLRPSPLAGADTGLYVGFLAKVNTGGTQLDLATYYGGDSKAVEAISIRSGGNLMVLASGAVAVLNPSLSQQISTTDTGVSQAALNFDGAGNVYVSGTIADSNVYGIRKYSPDLQTRLLDVSLTSNDTALFSAAAPLRVAITSTGRMYVSGRPAATNFPTRNATQTCLSNIAPPAGSAGVPVSEGTFGSVGDPVMPDNALMILGADGKPLHATYLSTTLAQPVVSSVNGKIYAAGTQTLFTTPRGTWNGLVRFDPAVVPADRVSPGCLVHSATFDTVAASPGTIMTIFGSHLGPATGVSFGLDASGKVPFSLAGVSITVDAKPATPLYVSDPQINFIIPWSTRTDGALVPICVTFDGATKCFQASTAGAVPGTFQGITGSAALNEDYSLNTVEGSYGRPAKRGSAVQIFMTGGGLLDGTMVDGGVTNTLQHTRATVTAIQSATGAGCGLLGCQNAGEVYNVNVAFAGAAPGLVQGVLQVNLDIPADMPAGPNQLFILYFKLPGSSKPVTATARISVRE